MLGVELKAKDVKRFMDKFSSTPGGVMSFHDFCHNFLGLPEDFFSMKLHRWARTPDCCHCLSPLLSLLATLAE